MFLFISILRVIAHQPAMLHHSHIGSIIGPGWLLCCIFIFIVIIDDDNHSIHCCIINNTRPYCACSNVCCLSIEWHLC